MWCRWLHPTDSQEALFSWLKLPVSSLWCRGRLEVNILGRPDVEILVFGKHLQIRKTIEIKLFLEGEKAKTNWINKITVAHEKW